MPEPSAPASARPAPTPDQQRALKARYRRIMRFATRVLVQAWWFELVLPRFGLGALAARGRIRRLQKAARRFHRLAADLGGLMIKAGQFLSSRLDVLPREITQELEGLQDEVAPEPLDRIVAQVERELGMPLSVAFASFDETPIAAASLGQAHRARLSPGLAAELGIDDVVVKVLRPGIEEIVEVDLAALRRVGRILSRVKLVANRTDAPALVEEFATTSLEEIDYLNEAAYAERFAADFADDPRMRTPAIIWSVQPAAPSPCKTFRRSRSPTSPPSARPESIRMPWPANSRASPSSSSSSLGSSTPTRTRATSSSPPAPPAGPTTGPSPISTSA